MQFNKEYILSLFKVCLSNKDTFINVQQHLKNEYLPTEDLRRFWDGVRLEFNINEEKTLPKNSILRMRFAKDAEILNLLKEIEAINLESGGDVLNYFEDFLKKNMLGQAFNEIVDTYNSQTLDKALNLFYESAKNIQDFSLKSNNFDTLFEDFETRQIVRINDRELEQKTKMPFFIDELDRQTLGGMELGESVLFLGDSGSGKSFILTYLGVNLARYGCNVAHFQAEGTYKQCMDRYDACWTGCYYYDMKKGITTSEDDRIKKILRNKVKGEVFIDVFEKFDTKNIMDIRKSLFELKKQGKDIKVVILDYLELIDPPKNSFRFSKEFTEKARQQKIARAIKDIAVEFNVVFITATQTNSISRLEKNDPKFVITRYNLSEDRGKLRPFDYLISINQTDDEQENGEARLYIDKAREYQRQGVIRICQNLGCARFYDRKRTLKEVFTKKDIEDDE